MASSNMMTTESSTMLSGPVGILWDIENCCVPRDVKPEDVAGNIRMALRVHPVITGAVTSFSAYGDFNAFTRRLREGCQRTGVKLVDVPNGRKDAADKAILLDMFLFALDNPPPSSILLISGDVDFAPALHVLGQRGYTVILVIPTRVHVSSALTNAGRFVWDWPSLARGGGFVPPKYPNQRAPNLACYFSSVVKEPSRGLLPTPEGGNQPTIVPCAPSKAQSLPCNVVVDRTLVEDHDGQVHDTMEILEIKDSKGQLAASNKDEENDEKRVVAAFPLRRYLQYAGVMLLGGFALRFLLRSSEKEAPSKGSWRNIHELLEGCI